MIYWRSSLQVIDFSRWLVMGCHGSAQWAERGWAELVFRVLIKYFSASQRKLKVHVSIFLKILKDNIYTILSTIKLMFTVVWRLSRHRSYLCTKCYSNITLFIKTGRVLSKEQIRHFITSTVIPRHRSLTSAESVSRIILQILQCCIPSYLSF